MNKTSEILTFLESVNPYMQPEQKSNVNTISKYCFVVGSILYVVSAIMGLWNIYVSSLPNSIKLMGVVLLILSVIFILVFYFFEFISPLIKIVRVLIKKEDIFLKADRSKEILLHDEKYAQQLDKNYKSYELEYTKELLVSLINRCKERVKNIGISISATVIFGVISFIYKDLGSFSLFINELKENQVMFWVMLVLTAFAAGLAIGTFVLRVLISRYNYSGASIEIALLQKKIKKSNE